MDALTNMVGQSQKGALSVDFGNSLGQTFLHGARGLLDVSFRSGSANDDLSSRDGSTTGGDTNYVQHSYRDHSHEAPPAYEFLPAREVTFPLKLHDMLDCVERDCFAHIISWQAHGRCFVIHKPEYMDFILPRYFKISKWSSFQRQLNLYGFKRITQGLDKGGYYHETFLRGKRFLATRIHRMRVKGEGPRAKANPDQEPDFWRMPYVQPGPPQKHKRQDSYISLSGNMAGEQGNIQTSSASMSLESFADNCSIRRRISDESITSDEKDSVKLAAPLPSNSSHSFPFSSKPELSASAHAPVLSVPMRNQTPSVIPLPLPSSRRCSNYNNSMLQTIPTDILLKDLGRLAQKLDKESLDFFCGIFSSRQQQLQALEEGIVGDDERINRDMFL